jgi:hypothetical protein
MDKQTAAEIQAHVDGPSVLLMGETGTGKTTSISTLAIHSGLEVFILITEPSGLESVIDSWISRGVPRNKLRYHVINPVRDDIAGLIDMGQKIGRLDFSALASQKPTSNRINSKWHEMLKWMQDFRDDATGQSFGSIFKFSTNKAFVVDSLSGINDMAMDMVLGDKIQPGPGEWGLAMKNIQKLLALLCSNLKCTFVLTSHLEQEIDETTGGRKLYASTLGKKLAPVIPRYFSEVVLAYREGDKFYWSTSTHGVALKNRGLPLSGKLEPDFKPIIDRYLQRLSYAAEMAIPNSTAPKPAA